MIACEGCGTTFSATSPRARFCSDRCRKRVSRAGGSSKVTGPPVTFHDGKLTAITWRTLIEAGRENTVEGAIAVNLAQRLDAMTLTGGGSASTMASIAHEYTKTMVKALRSAVNQVDDLGPLRARRRRSW